MSSYVLRRGAVSLVAGGCLVSMGGCSLLPSATKSQSAEPGAASTTGEQASETAAQPEQTTTTTTTTTVVTVTAQSNATTTVAAPTSSGPVVLPRVAVQIAGGSDPTSLQKFADDIASGNIDNVVKQCWTVAPERIRSTFTESGRRAFLRTLATTSKGAQYGAYWENNGYMIGVPWNEVKSPYACASLSGPGIAPVPSPADAALIVRRLDGRVQSHLVNPHDISPNYYTLCDSFPPLENTENLTKPERELLTAAQRDFVHRLATEGGVMTANGRYRLSQSSSKYVEVSDEGDVCVADIAA